MLAVEARAMMGGMGAAGFLAWERSAREHAAERALRDRFRTEREAVDPAGAWLDLAVFDRRHMLIGGNEHWQSGVHFVGEWAADRARRLRIVPPPVVGVGGDRLLRLHWREVDWEWMSRRARRHGIDGVAMMRADVMGAFACEVETGTGRCTEHEDCRAVPEMARACWAARRT